MASKLTDFPLFLGIYPPHRFRLWTNIGVIHLNYWIYKMFSNELPLKSQAKGPGSRLNLQEIRDSWVRWSVGPLVRWPVGPLVRWPVGPLARKPVGSLAGEEKAGAS